MDLLHWQLIPFNEGLKRKAGALEYLPEVAGINKQT